MKDGDNGKVVMTAGEKKTTMAATYVTGPYTIVFLVMTMMLRIGMLLLLMASGDTTVTVAADETETYVSWYCLHSW